MKRCSVKDRSWDGKTSFFLSSLHQMARLTRKFREKRQDLSREKTFSDIGSLLYFFGWYNWKVFFGSFLLMGFDEEDETEEKTKKKFGGRCKHCLSFTFAFPSDFFLRFKKRQKISSFIFWRKNKFFLKFGIFFVREKIDFVFYDVNFFPLFLPSSSWNKKWETFFLIKSFLFFKRRKKKLKVIF